MFCTSVTVAGNNEGVLIGDLIGETGLLIRGGVRSREGGVDGGEGGGVSGDAGGLLMYDLEPLSQSTCYKLL